MNFVKIYAYVYQKLNFTFFAIKEPKSPKISLFFKIKNIVNLLIEIS